MATGAVMTQIRKTNKSLLLILKHKFVDFAVPFYHRKLLSCVKNIQMASIHMTPMQLKI